MIDQAPGLNQPLATLGELVDQHAEAGLPTIVLARRASFIDRIADRIRDRIDELRDDTIIAIEMRPVRATMIALGIGIIGGSAIRLALRPRRPVSRGW